MIDRLNANLVSAAATARAGSELAEAAGRVVAARLAVLAEATADPLHADLDEMALMGTEKAVALAQSLAGLGLGLAEAGQRLMVSAEAEARHAGQAFDGLTLGDGPAGVVLAQALYALGWWERALGGALAVNASLLEAQAEALRPIHAAALANARRLGP